MLWFSAVALFGYIRKYSVQISLQPLYSCFLIDCLKLAASTEDSSVRSRDILSSRSIQGVVFGQLVSCSWAQTVVAGPSKEWTTVVFGRLLVSCSWAPTVSSGCALGQSNTSLSWQRPSQGELVSSPCLVQCQETASTCRMHS